jgi:hypothetical protein
LVLCASPCFAWGPEGHRIIALIAGGYLTDKAKAEVKDLLGDQSLGDASNWADEVRGDPKYDWAKPLHYINVPRDATSVDLTRDCPDGNCVVAAIKKYSGILRDKSAPRQERIEALKFLIHFVGDVHQPLHASYADDRGGNEVKVTWLQQPDWNLHRVWDLGLIQHAMADSNEKAFADKVRDSVAAVQIKQWRNNMDPAQWASESLTMTRRIYSDLPTDHVIGEMYYEQNVLTVQQRLAAASFRLAALLNDIFADESATKPQETPALTPAASHP